MSGLAFIDTETTGLDPERNPIWEIAVIVDDVEHCWQVKIPRFGRDFPIVGDDVKERPMGYFMTQWVLDNTGFKDRYDDATAMTRFGSIERFAELVRGRHLVGAVPSFDEERLRGEYRLNIDADATQFPWHYHLIDVEALAVGYRFGRAAHEGYDPIPLPWRSDDLSLGLGIDPPSDEDRHTALADARWAKAIYEAVAS